MWRPETTTKGDQVSDTPRWIQGKIPTSRLGSDVQVKGEVSGEEDLVIGGSVEGVLRLGDHKLTITTTAKIAANITAGEVVIYGHVRGDVRASRKIDIHQTGSVIGDLTTRQILIEDGANFKGSIEIEKPTEQEIVKKAFSPAA